MVARHHRPFRYHRSVLVAAPPEDLWATIADLDRYPRWWSWLGVDEPPGPLTAGAQMAVVIRPPMPYSLRLTIRADRVEPTEHVVATVTGDLGGTAAVTFAPRAGGTIATISWDLAPRRRLLRVLAVVGRPILRAGHDWVVRTGAVQFERATGLAVEWVVEDAGRPRRRWQPVLAGAAVAAGTLAVAARRRRA